MKMAVSSGFGYGSGPCRRPPLGGVRGRCPDTPPPPSRAGPRRSPFASKKERQHTHDAGPSRPAAAQQPRPGAHRRRDAEELPRLRDERDRGARDPRRARRAQARAPQDPLRHARHAAGVEPGVQEVRACRRRGARQVPPPRRPLGLRRPRAHGPGLRHAHDAGRRPGQLRQRRRRPRGGHALHRGAAHPPRRRAAHRHREGDRRFHRQLRRVGAGARGPPCEVPEPPGERLRRHRRGHGDEHPAAQPRRGHRRRRAHHRRARDHDGRPPRDREGPRLPHRGLHRRPPRDPSGLPHRPRLRGDAREGHHRAPRARRPRADRGHRDPVPGQQGRHAQEDGGARAGEAPGGHLRPARRELPRGHAGGDRAEARRHRADRAQQPLQEHPAPGELRDHQPRHRRRAAQGALALRDAPGVPRPPPRRGHPAHALRAPAGRGAARDRARPGHGHHGDRPDHPYDPRVARRRHGPRGPHAPAPARPRGVRAPRGPPRGGDRRGGEGQ